MGVLSGRCWGSGYLACRAMVGPPPHPPLRVPGRCRSQRESHQNPRTARGHQNGPTRANMRGNANTPHIARAMPRLRRTHAHHRDLPAWPDTPNPNTAQKAGRIMNHLSTTRSPARRSPRRLKKSFGSTLSMHRNMSQTKAKRLTKTPDCTQKTAQPNLQNSTTCPNSNRHREQTSVLSP